MNSSGENDGCLLFRHSSYSAILAAATHAAKEIKTSSPSFPPKAEMMNSSGENDGCLLFHRSTSFISFAARMTKVVFFVITQKH